MRYLFPFVCALALGLMPLVGCSDPEGTGGSGGAVGSGGSAGTRGIGGSGGIGGIGGDGGIGGTAGGGGSTGTGGVGGMVPVGGWPTGIPEEQGFDSDALADLIESFATGSEPPDSLLVVRNGILILDAYFYPYLGDRPHDLASVQKSVTSTLVGTAIDQGLLQGVDQLMMPLFADEYPDIPAIDGKGDITLEHLLTMSSGLGCAIPGTESDGEAILRMQSSPSWIRHVLELPMAYPPGDEWIYCTPAVHVLNAVIPKVSGLSSLDFAQQYLFGPLGFGDVRWPADPGGITGGALLLHPHDMAKLGHLFLNRGKWNEATIVSSGWVEDATKPSTVHDGYAYLWWISRYHEGEYEALGNGDQHIIVWPGKNLVIVVTGSGNSSRGAWQPGLLDALRSDQPLPANPSGYGRLTSAIADATNPPPPQAPYLPPIGEEISGKIYRLSDNRFGVRCFAVRFDPDNPSEASMDLTIEEGGLTATVTLPIGMDGVPRFSGLEVRGFEPAMEAQWVPANSTSTTLRIRYNQIGGSTNFLIESDFGSDVSSVEVEFIDETHYTPSETVPGVAVIDGTC